MPGWMKHKLEEIKIARRNISILRYADDTILMAGTRRIKEPLDESERE